MTVEPLRPGPAGSSNLIAQHDSLAVGIACRYSRGPRPDEDLVQVARLGLVLAASRFDAGRGPFGPYAAATIAGEIKRHLRDHDWNVRVPRGLQERALVVSRVTAELEQELGESPTVVVVAERTSMTVEQVLAARRALAARHADELRADPGAGEDGEVEFRMDLRRAVDDLDAADRELYELHFEQELSQRRIATRTGRSQTDVHRRLRAIVRRLSARMRER